MWGADTKLAAGEEELATDRGDTFETDWANTT